MGFLTIEGGSLVVLDGQHRLAALRGVTTAGPDLKGEFVDAVADDELSVLFIPHESFEKTRRIFNKVNRYAKPTSPTDNIITSEDDGSAIVTRWLVEEEPPLNTQGSSAATERVRRVGRADRRVASADAPTGFAQVHDAFSAVPDDSDHPECRWHHRLRREAHGQPADRSAALPCLQVRR